MKSRELADKPNKKHLEELIVGECPSCLEKTEFEYIGERETLRRQSFYLYNCKKCNTTCTLKSIKRFN